MARLLITSILRHTKPEEPSGFLNTVELASGILTGRCPLPEPPHTHADPNPRGGMRGAKGITLLPDGVLVANHSEVFDFDTAWRIRRVMSHPSCSGIHDILYQSGELWITSSRNDLVFVFGLDGGLRRVVNLRAEKAVRQALGWGAPNLLDEQAIAEGRIDFRDPRTHTYETYDGAHVNSLAMLPSGDILIMMGLVWTRSMTRLFTLKKYLKRWHLWEPLVAANKAAACALGLKKQLNTDMAFHAATGQAAVVRVHPEGRVSVPLVLRQCNTPVHSLLAEPDGTVLFDDTSAGDIVRFHPDTGAILARTPIGEPFLRGLARVSEREVVAGGVRGIYLVELEAGQVVQRIPLFENPNESVYDIKVLPDTFHSLPEALAREDV